ncbi:hypothetical protein D0Y53_05650 [Luteimonas weifangensis]|uniref:DUF2946 domain-containing protein n=2 Tax=Cognatiluteimonas weifangensis TaxID=2303539 RepID=A0A372DPC5_9GAMM|nr:hypothetical protein D0Y53_05650 [Luteimonas weifangensis]
MAVRWPGCTIRSTMRSFRRHRLRARLSLLAMVALLWSQLAMAAHPGCLAIPAASEPAVAMASHGCEQEAPPHQEPLCQSHCSQGELSSDVARVPPVLPLPVMPAQSFVAVIAAPQAAAVLPDAVDGPPPVSWHRPTAHPAALLLI